MVAADSISTTTKHPVSPMTIVAVSSSSPDINASQQTQHPSRQPQTRDAQQDASLLGTDDISISSSMVDQTFSKEICRRLEMAVAQAKHFKQHQQQKCQTGGDDVVGTTTSTSSSINGDNEAMSSAADSVAAGTTTNIEIVQSPLGSDSTGSSSASSFRNGK